jgi:hypothetical protein
VVLVGPLVAFVVTCFIVFFARSDRVLGTIALGGLATATVTAASWLVIGVVGSVFASLGSRVSAPGPDAAPGVRWALAMAAWAYVDWRNASSGQVLPITHVVHLNSPDHVATTLANCAKDEHYGYHSVARRPHWTRAYSLVSTAVAIVVAIKTGGDPHSAALAKTGSMVALGLLHHVGRTVAESLLPPLNTA